MSKVCDRCFSADDVEPRPAQERLWEFSCTNVGKHADGQVHRWFDFNEPLNAAPADGTLEPYLDPLLACLTGTPRYLEFPIVEWRFRARAASLFDELVGDGGHVLLKPNTTKARTASIVLVQGLGVLRDRGVLVSTHLPATASWLKQKEVTYWSLPPAPLEVNAVTWTAYAEANGIADPQAGPSSTDDVLP